MTNLVPIIGVTKDEPKNRPPKPAIFKLYDFTMGGTDRCDQMMGFLSTRTKSRRWTVNTICYMLDATRVNAGTIHQLKQVNNK